MKRHGVCLSAMALAVLGWAWAVPASEVRANELVVVADTRVLGNCFVRYFADLYNTNIWMFAVWAVVLTAAYGCFLGLVMDFIMSRTGLDLKSRGIVER